MAKRSKALEIDTSQFEAMIAELVAEGDTTLSRAAVSALRSVANRAKKRTYAGFASLKVNPKVKRRGRAKGALGDTARGRGRVLSGKLVTIKKLKDKKPLVYIGIRGNWKAKFFELGTQQRFAHTKARRVSRAKNTKKALKAYLRGGASRGAITAGHYFKQALDDTAPELKPALTEALVRSIARAAAKARSKRGH